MQEFLVMGVSKDGATRRIFEDQFVARLRARGVQAVSSYTRIPEDGQLPEETVDEAMRDSGVDGVIVTRLVRVEQETAVMPGFSETTVTPGFGHRLSLGPQLDFLRLLPVGLDHLPTPNRASIPGGDPGDQSLVGK